MRGILTQTSWLFLTQVSARAVGFFYTIFLARNLGVQEFGLYTVALAYFAIIASVVDLGFSQFLTREVVKDRSKASELLYNIILLRLVISSILFAVFSVVIYLFDPDKMRVSLVLLATLSILPLTVASTFDAIFVAIQKLQFSGISLLISSLLTVVSGLFLVENGLGSLGAVNALLFGQLIYAIVLFAFLYKRQRLVLTSVNLSLIRKAVVGSLPYGVLGIIGFISFKVDTVILSYSRGNFDTGIYGAAYKFFEASSFIPVALATASYPVFVKSLHTNLIYTKVLYFRSLKLMFLTGLGIMLIYLLIVPDLMRIFLPEYQSSIELLKILSLAIPFIFLHVPSNQLLLSTDKYLKQLIIVYTALFSINIILYLIFISLFGAQGAAWITVVSEISTFTALFLYISFRMFK